jgi:nucleotide-binding universal stress UspA family protein
MSGYDEQRLHGHVVAGTGDTEAARSAVRHAAREADARRVVLELVHVLPTESYLAAAADCSPQAWGVARLEDDRQLVLSETPQVTVALSLLNGPSIERLVSRATDAQLLVVGAPSPGLTERLRPGSAALGAAGQAVCPVVVVPADQPAVGQLRRIVVGLKSPARADDELLWSAFAEARRHRAELAVVHAWQPQDPYPDAVAGARHDPGWLPGEAALVEERLIGLRHAFPGVQVRVDVVRGDAADTLVAASAEGSLVMLARSRVRGPARALGPTARAVLQRARCPVELVPASRTHTEVLPRTLAGLAHH